MALSFEVPVRVNISMKFHSSTIWPKVNELAAKVDALEAADDALIAEILALKGKTP